MRRLKTRLFGMGANCHSVGMKTTDGQTWPTFRFADADGRYYEVPMSRADFERVARQVREIESNGALDRHGVR